MLNLRRNRFLRFLLLPLTLVAMSACQTTQWKSAGFAPFDTRRELPSPARLTLNNRSSVRLLGARFEADSIIGTRADGETRAKERMAVHVDSVRHIERLHVNKGGTGRVLLIGGAVLAVAFVITLIQLDEALDGLGE